LPSEIDDEMAKCSTITIAGVIAHAQTFGIFSLDPDDSTSSAVMARNATFYKTSVDARKARKAMKISLDAACQETSVRFSSRNPPKFPGSSIIDNIQRRSHLNVGLTQQDACYHHRQCL
jgi:hypothetical protein